MNRFGSTRRNTRRQNRISTPVIFEELSFDRSFHSPENQDELAKLVKSPCLPKPGFKQAAEQSAAASLTFRAAKQRYPGIAAMAKKVDLQPQPTKFYADTHARNEFPNGQ